MRAVVDHSVQARLITVPSVTREVTVGLRYDRHDPFAVSLVFPPDVSLDGQEVVWVFSRELLEDGLRAAVGLGDVHIRPSGPERPEQTVIELRAPEGVAVIEFDSTGLLRFLHGTYGVVPGGSEHLELDLDRGLTSLLG
ncbi:SsgA family sporulation/cell division regulator [Streptomyces barkulensis]|uniref:SsgA family sporulation/cell division regulator n=1 Tax=Streptomyces barkulensis TaxID=1257026 RepID=UPI000C6DAF00|nr:SsgA family sporulation/cell division regulator [Streptomyces barkulensis]